MKHKLLACAVVVLMLIPGCSTRFAEMGVIPMRQPAAGRVAEAFPGSRPSLDEEIWVIARPAEEGAIQPQEDPGSGQMVTREPVTERVVPVPLKHTDVKAAIAGYIASVTVQQQFHNPYDGKIEAVYVFPLPHNAAVSEFVMVIGERRIRGIIREREEAEQIYQEARRQGYVASLLTQERPNIFTQAVANIEPGRQIDVVITYFHTLAHDDGWYEWVFPMVVGPRFNPPGWTNAVAAVARGQTGNSDQRTEVSYLKPDERSGHDIALEVSVNAGVDIEEFICRSHVVEATQPESGRLRMSLNPNDRLPNKDFVLRYRVAGGRLKSGLLTHRDARGGFFTLMLHPPAELTGLSRQPIELVFVLDCSGSMRGWPIDQAKRAAERALRQLRPEDSFQIIRFSEGATQLGPAPLPATSGNVQKGLSYLQRLEGGGGTMMIEGVKAALEFPHDPERLRFVCLLTDGYIGNETEIFEAIQERLGDARILSFGVGSSVNRFLLEQMARVGRGAVAYIGRNDGVAGVMDAFVERISHPALTDVAVAWGDWQAKDVFPRRLPDLFVGRPVIVTGRFEGEGTRGIQVGGRAGGRSVGWEIPVPRGGGEESCPALPSVWARMKIAELGDHLALDPNGEIAGEMKQVALDFNLMSAWTAFVAVDSSRRTEGEEATTVPVPVPVPEGVKYQTTVGN